jgi:hypothetical protein
VKLGSQKVKLPMDDPGTSQRYCWYWKSRKFRGDIPRIITGLWVFTG